MLTPNTTLEEEVFQEYLSAKSGIRLVTPKGFRITFTDGRYLTQRQDVIDYLDNEIKEGLRAVTKGKSMTSSDLDPMESLRKKFFAEFAAKQAEEAKNKALGILPDMGTTEAKAGIKVASSATVAK